MTFPPTHHYTGANHQSVKQANRATIFRAIHAFGPIARVDLARQTGLNPGTVTNIVDELLASGLARELEAIPEARTPRNGRVGRKPVYLRVIPTARYAIGVDLARSWVTGAVVDLTGQHRVRFAEPTEPLLGHLAIAQVRRMITRLIDDLTADERERLVGIGIGAPGPLSIRSGRFLAPPSYGAWDELDFAAEIARGFGLPTIVDNNANTSALAELWFGAGQGLDNFVLLTLGTGVGAGLVINGDVYRGDHDLAGEVGHTSIALDGPRCACGNYGCLELFVSVPKVLAATHAALAAGEPSVLRDDMSPAGESVGALTVARLAAAVADRDPLACRVVDDVARYLAAGIVNVVNMLDPRIVLIGRELAELGEDFLERVRAEVNRRIVPAARQGLTVQRATLPLAGVTGGAILALREFFADPLRFAEAATERQVEA